MGLKENNMVAKKIEKSRKDKVVITVRIDKSLDDILNKLRVKIGLSKAELIRNYLNMVNYISLHKGSLKSLDNRNFIIFKRELLNDCLNKLSEIEQIHIGEEMARFLNDIARIKGQIDNLEFKLELCENFGYFPFFIDTERYIYITHEFGPLKFVEAFMWQLIYQEKYTFIESEMASNKKLKSQYNKQVVCVPPRSSINYTFEFAKMP